MKTSVIFYFSSPTMDERIKCEVAKYPFKPGVGDDVCIPISQETSPNEHMSGLITRVVHNPLGCYFADTGCEIECYVRVGHDNMESAWNFLIEKERASGGKLTHQWANWKPYKV